MGKTKKISVTEEFEQDEYDFIVERAAKKKVSPEVYIHDASLNGVNKRLKDKRMKTMTVDTVKDFNNLKDRLILLKPDKETIILIDNVTEDLIKLCCS